jgi:5-methyltetrahydrofolate--homocysteine methyltransferase
MNATNRKGEALTFREKLSAGRIFFDGAMGTMIQKSGAGYTIPEELNHRNPDCIRAIHGEYLKAGCEVITTNTFGANRLKLGPAGYGVAETIGAAVGLARAAIEEAVSGPAERYVALDIGPIGVLLEPMGSLGFDEALEIFREEALAGAGADLAIVETMGDLYEAKAAILAVKEHTDLPVIASVTFQENNRMLTGADVLSAVTCLEAFGADVIGFNCGGGLEQAALLAADFLRFAELPLLIQPNAGIPVVENGETVFPASPREFAETLRAFAESGVRILGGCCGTTPAHIAEAIRLCKTLPHVPRPTEGGDDRKGETRVASYCRTVVIGRGEPKIVGERINPTGKKALKQALLTHNMQYILDEGVVQTDAGAHILDVNVGLPGTDEAELMLAAIRELQRALPAPLQVDSSEPAVLERALRYYNGKALINSVNGKASSMEGLFPLVKKYGGVVIALTLDEGGIPETADGRLAIARRIVNRAADYGIARRDIIIDPLTLTVSSNQGEAPVTLETIRRIKAELGLATILGVSNISFGLPRREIITGTFLALALEAGLDACIINPCSAYIMGIRHAFLALSGEDKNCLGYIETYANTTGTPEAPPPKAAPPGAPAAGVVPSPAAGEPPGSSELRRLIIGGFLEQSAAATEELLKTNSPVNIIDGHIIPALDTVGKEFESGEKFLPQLLLSADTVSRAFGVIKDHLARTGEKQQEKGPILLATVYGDIHDIGKNIVKAMLENYGYRVIDMGKDVEPGLIVDRMRQEDIPLIGLGALMTTTVSNMAKTIRAIRETNRDVKIMAGGAVLTGDYAKKIGADYYVKDAMAAVAVAKHLFEAGSLT